MQLTTSSPFRSLPRRIAAVAVVGLVGLGTCACAWAFSTDGKGAPASQTHPAAAGTKVDPGVMAGQTLTRVNPEYPEDAKKAHLEGSVVLKAQIGADGKIDNLTIQSGDPTLGQAALDAVRQWTYKPYVMNGQPVAVETTITVNFKLND